MRFVFATMLLCVSVTPALAIDHRFAACKSTRPTGIITLAVDRHEVMPVAQQTVPQALSNLTAAPGISVAQAIAAFQAQAQQSQQQSSGLCNR